MKIRKMPLTVLFALPALAVLLLLLYRPAYVNISMDGMQMTTDGTAILERKITLEGWHLSPLFGQETIKVTKLSVDGFPYSLPRQASSPVFPHTDGVCFADCALLSPDNIPVNCDFMWASSEEFCLIHMDGYFFIGTTDTEYQEILELYQGVISFS